jgi:hypothetical protein
VTLAILLYAVYLFVPPNGSRYATMKLGDFRGVYNSAWVGTLVSLLTSTFLGMAGFYLIKNAVERDRNTGVGQILAATVLSKPMYTLGKALSNFALLATMVALIAAAAGGMQLLRGEDSHLHLWQLLAPFLLLALPMMAVISSLGVMFESIRFLRGGLGNVVYFVLIMFVLTGTAFNRGLTEPVNDLPGIGIALPGIFDACETAYPEYHRAEDGFSMGFTVRDKGEVWALRTFRWEGVIWTPELVGGRLVWFGAAAAVGAFAAVFFDRFDSAPIAVLPGRTSRSRRKNSEMAPEMPVEDIVPSAMERASPHIRFPSWSGFAPRGRFWSVVVAELRLTLKGINRWWYLPALGLLVAGALAPLDVARQYLLPFAWIWPLTIWSGLGVREARYRTEELLFSAPRPIWRQLPASWFAAVLITAALGGGVGIRLVLAADVHGFFAWLVGALFIPSLALCAGAWTGSSRLFEIVYLSIWYAGPLNRAPVLDFMGVTAEGSPSSVTVFYLAATIALLLLALLGRYRQMHR